MSRFDYVQYDEKAQQLQAHLKTAFQGLDHLVEVHMLNGRAKSLVMTKLEEAYMWCGKAIRDDQVLRNEKTELQEQRTNS
jgi:hypothetical protein